MDFNSTEEQQLETLKRWWAEYGKSIILGAVVGLGGLFGWRYYQDNQVETRAAGADNFANISTKLAAQGPDAFTEVAAFAEQNQGNNYGEMAALLLAGEAAKANQLPLAQQQLELALAGSKDAAISETIRLRLARVLLAQDKADEAQAQLNGVKQEAFSALRSEIQGDLYAAKGNTDEAYLAYQAAAEAGGLNNNPALKLKLDNLATANADVVASPVVTSSADAATDVAPTEPAAESTPSEASPAVATSESDKV
ncbi:YfgM family protein [Oceanisphaera sp. W20_SRM_FM3]|uniref:YfgM family protein n=1 Tax=Oceanisphaera sp. W20_SRM_FM3 TaxID=3240267 RepID=UPI003F9BC5F7